MLLGDFVCCFGEHFHAPMVSLFIYTIANKISKK